MGSKVAVLLYAAAVIGLVRELSDAVEICLTTQEAVFPYWSLCGSPATYAYSGGVYTLQSQGNGSTNGYYLAPEWDEVSSTYYVRLVEDATSGARYELTHRSREIREYVSPNDSDIIIVNADTGRALKWHVQEEGGAPLLAEEDLATTSSALLFEFSLADSILLPCPRIANVRCQAYHLVSVASCGLSPYEAADGVVYLTPAIDNLMPFTLAIANMTV